MPLSVKSCGKAHAGCRVCTPGWGGSLKGRKVNRPPAPEKCVHHWMVPTDEAVNFRGVGAVKYEGCIGRPSVCKNCGATKTLAERHDYYPYARSSFP